MTNLKELIVIGNCGVDNGGISNINLKKLDARCNPNISNMNHMTNLEELVARGICGHATSSRKLAMPAR